MPRQSIERRCLVCQNPFRAALIELARGGGKYCSRECYYTSQRIPIEEMFQRFVGPTTESGCVLWIGPVDKKGYGIIYSTSRPPQRLFLAHRIAWEFKNGVIPNEMDVLHACDNPPCINTNHLFLGTHQDNMADMMAKNRQRKGEATGTAKLTAEIVCEIRRLAKVGGITQIQLAHQFGVHPNTINVIVNRHHWKHVT